MTSTDLRDLYQELILDHSKRPKNFVELPAPCQKVEGYNPLCGDRYTLFATLDEGIVKEIGFQGAGCAISKASASLMTEAIKGKTRQEAEKLFDAFHDMISGQPGQTIKTDQLGKLAVFSGVCEYPMRVKCASLAWHTLKSLLENKEDAVSTE